MIYVSPGVLHPTSTQLHPTPTILGHFPAKAGLWHFDRGHRGAAGRALQRREPHPPGGGRGAGAKAAVRRGPAARPDVGSGGSRWRENFVFFVWGVPFGG